MKAFHIAVALIFVFAGGANVASEKKAEWSTLFSVLLGVSMAVWPLLLL